MSAMKHAPRRRDRFLDWTGKESTFKAGIIASIIAGLVFVIWLLTLVFSLASRAERADTAITQQTTVVQGLATANAKQDAALAAANARLKQLGQPTVPVPSTPPTAIPGPAGPGPTSAQIDAAVARWCATSQTCKGTAAPAPTLPQMLAAVTAYCSANPCGTEGKAGADGATGAQGPGPTDAQISAAISSYCAANTCGTKGDSGTALPGTYTCPGSEVLHGFTVAAGGAVILDCQKTHGSPIPD